MNRTRQRSMATAVEFLKANGGDPTRWGKLDRVVRRRSQTKQERDIERLAADTVRHLDRTRDAPVIDTFGPRRP